jgi:hypothetical protein
VIFLKQKFVKIFIKWFFPFLLFLILAFFTVFLPYYQYILTALFFLLTNYYLFILFNISFGEKKINKDSLYVWLDQLDGGKDLLLFLLKENKQNNVIKNLLTVSDYFYQSFDYKELKLLRGYFRTLDEEGPLQMIIKTIIGILISIIIWGITKGHFLEIVKVDVDPNELDIHPTYFSFWIMITIIFEILLIFSVFIKDYFENKKRNKMILEILDVCIEGIEQKEQQKNSSK